MARYRPSNDCFIKALHNTVTSRRPIWLMRQAGRYLPEYRKIRQKQTDFMLFCKTPELACQATLQPLLRFPLDAAIIFSDILTICDSMGFNVAYLEGQGPTFETAVTTDKQLNHCQHIDIPNSMSYVAQAIDMVAKEIGSTTPIIGFAGSPWTVASYMVNGHATRDFLQVRKILAEKPLFMEKLIKLLTQYTIDYLAMQIEAGVSAIMLFDTWGNIIPTQYMTSMSLKPLKTIVTTLHEKFPDIPVIVYSRAIKNYTNDFLQLGCQALSIDWTMDLHKIRKQCGSIAIQGNLDPAILLTNPGIIKKHTEEMLKDAGTAPGYIANLGHGVNKDTPIENISCFIDTVRNFEIINQGVPS